MGQVFFTSVVYLLKYMYLLYHKNEILCYMITRSNNVQKQNILSNCLVSMVKMLVFFLLNYSLWLSLKVDRIGHLFIFKHP